MAYTRATPGFNKDPEIKKKETANPDGSVTYSHNWSSSTPGKSSKGTTARRSQGSTAARTTPAKKSVGDREFTTVPAMKRSGTTGTEIKASASPKAVTPNAPETPQESRVRRFGVPGERVYGKPKKKEGWYGVGGSTGDKNKSGSCTRC